MPPELTEEQQTPMSDGCECSGEADVLSSATHHEIRRQLVVMAAGAAQVSAILQALGLIPIVTEAESALEHLLNAAMMMPVERDEMLQREVTKTNT